MNPIESHPPKASTSTAKADDVSIDTAMDISMDSSDCFNTDSAGVALRSRFVELKSKEKKYKTTKIFEIAKLTERMQISNQQQRLQRQH